QHGIEKRRHAKLVNDAQGCRGMRQVGQQPEAVSALEGGQHLQGARNGSGIIDKGAKICLNCQGNTRVIGFDVMAETLQGGADPEPIVRLFTVLLRRLHKPPGCGPIDGEKGLVCKAKTTALQALRQSPYGFLTTQVVHQNEGLEEVKTNRGNMLHDVVCLPWAALASTRWRVEYLAA